MKVLDLFAGIGGFSLGLGMETVAQVEIEPDCREVLARHWPNVTRLEDVRNVGGEFSVDLISGGFPCQGFSLAGGRRGMDDPRSGLWFEFARIIEGIRPRWVVIENVPGLLSSRSGRDMGIVTGTLAQLGYEWAYRVLDAQYFGVPQRRRRVYIVGHYGRRGSAVRVLFDDVQATVDTEAVTRAKHPPSERAEGLPRAFVIQYNDGGSHKRADRPKGGMYVYETPHALTVGTPDTLVLVTPEGPRYCTTIEVERLMGFPDGWTEGHSKTRRFLMLRNAVVVPVIEWLGQRIVKEHNETVP